jgi:hypothetical protein
MNDITIKLGLESGMLNYVDNETPRQYFLSGHADEQDLSKFAELIVRECVQSVIDNTPAQFTNEVAVEDWERGYDRAMTDCVHFIKEHFGVNRERKP